VTPSSTCAALVKSFEGCVLNAYPDPATKADPWTVGFGHTGPEVKRGVVWTLAQAESALTADLARFGRIVANAIGTTPTSQHQFDAMTSLIFNIGPGNFLSSTLLRKHCARDYVGAAEQFLRWNKAAGKVMAGLTKRRAAERELYLS